MKGKVESRLAVLEKNLPVPLTDLTVFGCVKVIRPQLQKLVTQKDDPQRRLAAQELLGKARCKTSNFAGLTDAALNLLMEVLQKASQESAWKTR